MCPRCRLNANGRKNVAAGIGMVYVMLGLDKVGICPTRLRPWCREFEWAGFVFIPLYTVKTILIQVQILSEPPASFWPLKTGCIVFYCLSDYVITSLFHYHALCIKTKQPSSVDVSVYGLKDNYLLTFLVSMNIKDCFVQFRECH